MSSAQRTRKLIERVQRFNDARQRQRALDLAVDLSELRQKLIEASDLLATYCDALGVWADHDSCEQDYDQAVADMGPQASDELAEGLDEIWGMLK